MTSHGVEDQLPTQELARRLHRSNMARQFGFRLEAAEPGRAVVRMQVRSRHKQVHGVVHGGILAALADTAGGLATYMAVPRSTRVATLEMKINFLEAVDHGALVADARVLRKGKNFAVVDCEVTDSAGRLAAKALMTFSIGPIESRSPKPAGGTGA